MPTGKNAVTTTGRFSGGECGFEIQKRTQIMRNLWLTNITKVLRKGKGPLQQRACSLSFLSETTQQSLGGCPAFGQSLLFFERADGRPRFRADHPVWGAHVKSTRIQPLL